ncbi:hypothetical protein [uncultured Duncaniella sp.]|uniref:hypothetical protein n=1 Tax=uncultured Duncaniella sp. TaxID=2768039 RepID=UPI0025AA26A4|nr:hypothetical protein [uncultured Duncaniella sp.]
MSENALVQIIGRAIPFTKENQRATAQTLVSKVVEGETDPIQAFSTVKALVECLTIFLKDKDVVESTIAACEKYGHTGALFNGANLCVAEVGVKYDYSACNDPEWDDLSKQRAELDAKIKARETFLRGIPREATILNEDTGEITKIVPPTKTSSTTVKVTFAR